MKRLNIIAQTVTLAAAALGCSLSAAAGSSTLAATGTISGVCKFSAASTPLAFGTIDPSSLTNATVNANVLYKCTNGTASAGVTATGGTARTMTSGVNNLSYTIAITGDTQTGSGFGAGTDKTLVVAGTITPAQFQNAVAGAYGENVTLNITP